MIEVLEHSCHLIFGQGVCVILIILGKDLDRHLDITTLSLLCFLSVTHVSDLVCTLSCPFYTNSPASSDHATDCTCNQGYTASEDGVKCKQNKVTCTVSG